MRLKLPAAAASVVCLVFLTSIAFAGSTPKKGWWVDVEGMSATPGNVNTPIIISGVADGGLNTATGEVSTEVEWMDFSSDLAWRLGVGYSWGDKGALSVSYWNYKDDQSTDGIARSYDDGGGPRYPMFGIGPASNIGYSFYSDIRFDFSEELKANTIDIEYTRAHDMNKTSITWGVGLRLADFEENTDGLYEVNPPGGFRMPAERHVEGDGWGFTGTLGAAYGFYDWFGIHSKLRVGFLNTDVDSESSITDQDQYYTYPNTVTWTEESGVNNEVSNTVDFNFDLCFNVWEYLDVDVGYAYMTWSDIASPNLSRSDIFTDDQGVPNLPNENRDRISWSGPRVMVKWKFGG